MRSAVEVARYGDELERILAEARLSESQELQAWDIWVARGHKRAVAYVRTIMRLQASQEAPRRARQAERQA